MGDIHSLSKFARAQIACESEHDDVALAAQVVLLALAGYIARNGPGLAAVEVHAVVVAAKRSGVHDGSITSVPDSCRPDFAIADRPAQSAEQVLGSPFDERLYSQLLRNVRRGSPHWRGWARAMLVGGVRSGVPRVPRQRMGLPRRRRRATVREAQLGGLPGRAVVADDPAQARGIQGRLCQLRLRA